MVSFKVLLLTAVSAVSVLAQEPTGDEAAAAAYWDAAATTDAVAGDAPEKIKRTDAPVLKDPYKGLWCKAPYTEPPCATTCNRNNCFRALLNARDGSGGKHCPKEAFDFCCKYNKASDWEKYYLIKYYWKWIVKFVPYVANCKDSKDSSLDVLHKLNDACGCTLNHEVKVDITSDYYKLRHYWPGSPKCH